ncbi:MAG TPA: class I SAM-dependent DNA methyltransferase [Acidiferrobacterales bacterium]|nr:class I SAM-dependent DNA methyltransferase [Acidiferrobacterales bacterium]
MAIKKSELYSSLWQSCDELRGGMDASQYKDYVLVLLFVKYVSDKYAGQKDTLIEVPKGGGFADMVALKGNKEIGEKMDKIIGKLADAGTNRLRGVIDLASFNDDDKLGKGKEMVDRLSNLVAIFQNPDLDFSRNRAEGDDILGDAYEYLMRHFATESGKSKGQFYTPAEVSRVIAKVIGIRFAKNQSQTIYDPTCGSGSLLLKAADEAPKGITIYGQEKDNATAGMARMNMILHNNPTAEIWQANTLSAPHFKKNANLKTFDFVVANPPFSDKAWSNGLHPEQDEFNRFEDGIPPKKNGDYAYLLHILKSMKSTGKGAVILPHGVLFRGNVEADIRRNLVRKGIIKGIIGLPPNLFYGTGIPACIVVLDKEHAQARKGIFMIDASKGFMKDGNKNRLRHQDIHKIVDVFNKQIEVGRYSRMVPLAEIADPKNDYNLNIPRYIDSTDPEDPQDIEAHLKGGIPKRDVEGLSAYWQVCPTLKGVLFTSGDRPGYRQLKLEAERIKPTIFAHPEFVTFTQSVRDLFDQWRTGNTRRLKGIKQHDHPKALIETISEDLLEVFAQVPLIDKYDVYQHLMTYWADSMQDDVYMLVSDGWKDANKLRLIVEDEEKKNKERPDFVVGKLKYKADLIPPTLVIAHYFSEDKAAVEEMEAGLEGMSRKMEEMREEHGGEEGLLSAVVDEKGNISKGALTKRLDELKEDPEAADERKVLEVYFELIEQESAAGKKVKEAQKVLDAKVAAKYPKLTEAEIKTLVVDDKWLATLATDVQTELDRVSQALTGRIKQLAERYATPLPKLTDEVAVLDAKAGEHLKRMGFVNA